MIKIYTTPNCTGCKKAKEFFRELRVKYIEVELVDNTEAQRLLLEQTGTIVSPTFFIKGNWTVGYSKSKIKKLIFNG